MQKTTILDPSPVIEIGLLLTHAAILQVCSFQKGFLEVLGQPCAADFGSFALECPLEGNYHAYEHFQYNSAKKYK